MKIVLAPDKFKNSISAFQFCDVVEEGLKCAISSNIEVVKLPLADGGDDTIEIINYYLKGTFVNVKVHNPFFQKIEARYLYAATSKTAFIEMAEASGVKRLNKQQLDCKNATTLGTGEMIVDAINRGAKHIILGIGGSATNDCGIGMASALGYRFLDEFNEEVKPIGANLCKIKTIETSQIHPKVKDVHFKIACDVENVLYGEHGAVYVYAKQKGASPSDMELLEQGVIHFSKILEQMFNIQVQDVKGAGAAGGLGIASKVFLNGVLESGISLVKNLAGFDEQINNADWIITAEGKLDIQTFSGKTINGVLHSAKANHVKVAVFCGKLELSKIEIKNLGITYLDTVLRYSKNENDAMKNAKVYLKTMANHFAKTML